MKEDAAGPEEWPYRLGKKAATFRPSDLQLVSYMDVRQIGAPDHFRHENPPQWGEWQNNKYGNCTIVGAANENLLFHREGGIDEPVFSNESILADYIAVSDYVPGNPDTDDGADMGRVASYRRRIGLKDINGNRFKVDAYAWIKLEDMDYIKAALWLFGAVGLGFKFPDYAMKQFKERRDWAVETSGWGKWLGEWLTGETPGGHYVPAIGIAPNGNIITVTWGREQEMTPEFYFKYADEVLAFMDKDRITKATNRTPQGFDLARLKHDFKAVARSRVYERDDRRSRDEEDEQIA